MKSQVKCLLKDESGATAIEYGLIAGFISIAMYGSLPIIHEHVGTIFESIASFFEKAP